MREARRELLTVGSAGAERLLESVHGQRNRLSLVNEVADVCPIEEFADVERSVDVRFHRGLVTSGCGLRRGQQFHRAGRREALSTKARVDRHDPRVAFTGEWLVDAAQS
ncbi:MAG: hypothetical protein DI536_34180 [Archangium gephyra]|uniref:Uncharacterized protein n=1 Tax=Archangium gephyra TaxID=48 RepID=A0A2W5SMN6_9BACT|nr:MAG: hypothetical protein DI536_34180 [Archangium gephyra]